MPPEAKPQARDPALTWDVPPELGDAPCVGPARAAFEAASAGHGDALAAQLLEAEGVTNVKAWAPVIGRLAREAAGFVSPAAGGPDLHAAIKIKRLATDAELPHASMAIDGVACHKTVSHKRMRTLIQGPRVVTLSGALEPPAADADKLSSIDALGSAGQRLGHWVDAIKELRPDVVCVEGGAARGAQEALLEAGVSLVTGVKPALLARIARCVGSTVRPVGGPLAEDCVGSCQVFEVFQSTEPAGGDAGEEPASLMLFKGCCRGAGATIVLQGLSREELAKVKRAARWAAYVALWNAREAAFLADDFALAAANLMPRLSEEAAGAEAARMAAESSSAAGAARAQGTGVITSASPHVSVFRGAEELTLEETHLDFASAQKLVLASSCRNPARAGAALCEPPHLLDMPLYRAEDLPLPEFLQAAAPAASKCGQCGDKASLHLRSFFHGDALVTLSSVVLPPEGQLPEGVWYWLRRLKDPRAELEVRRVRLDPDSERISFAHLLQLLLDARHRALGGASLHRDFVRYFGVGRTVICLHHMRVAPFAVSTPAPTLHVAQEATAGWLAEEAKLLVETADELFDSLQAAVGELPGAAAAATAESCSDIRKDFIKLVRAIPTGPNAHVTSSLQDMDRLRGHLADLAARCALVREPSAAAQQPPKASKPAPEGDQNPAPPQSAHSRASSGASSGYGLPPPSAPAPDAARAPTLVDSDIASAMSSPSFRDHVEAIPTGLVARFVAKFQQHEQADAAASERERVGSFSRQFGPSTTIDLRRGSDLRRTSTIDESLENKLERLSISIAQLHATPEPSAAAAEEREKQAPVQPASPPLLQALFAGRAMALDGPDANSSPPVFVYDKEPTSIVAFFLSSKQYQAYVDEAKTSCLSASEAAVTEEALAPSGEIEDEQVLCAPVQLDCQMIAEDENSSPATRARFQMTAYYAPHFAALRKMCIAGGEESYLASMRRCIPWAAQGGKSNVFFAKTKDGRYIIKQLTRSEKQSVLEYAPDYFKHLEAGLVGEGTSCLAKILGIYQVQVDYASGRPSPIGKDGVIDFIVMENLFHNCHVHTVYDLKGSERDRYVAAADLLGVKGGGPITLLDDNLRELNRTSPTLVTPAAFIKLQHCLCDDTNFLASLGVMDYSLLVGFDKVRQELVVGLVDYVRQYTWDKQVESWVKKSGLLGGAGKEPTIISPLQYARRFREAMLSYFTVVPSLLRPPEDVCETD